MGKRVLGVFCAFILLFTAVIGRVVVIDTHSDYVHAAQTHSIYTVTLARTRGRIYDRSGQPLAGGLYGYKALVVPSAETSAALMRYLPSERFDAIRDALKGSFPFAVDVPDGTCESDGITVYRVPKRYSPATPAVHLVGRCGSNGGESGIEYAYDDLLSAAAGELTVTCRVDAAGRSLAGARQTVTDTTARSASGVILTIDTTLQHIAEDAAGHYLESGAVVLLDADSSEILAMVSFPDYDRDRIADYLDDSRAPLVNRAIAAYNAGSVFKPVIAAAALENGLDPLEVYECTGAVTVGNHTMGCIHHTAHGSVALRDAIEHSCNTYFIHTAQQTGGDALLQMAQRLGFGESTALSDRYTASAGTLPSRETLRLPAELANFSFGQGKLTVTPVQVAGLFATIARGGIYLEPRVVRGLTDDGCHLTAPSPSPVPRSAMRQETAEILRECLRAAVLEGTAKAGASDRVTSAAKTGTAETGIVKNGRTINQAWYAGFFPYEQPRYVCVVLAEGGSSGGSAAGPVFKEIAERVMTIPDAR